VTDPRDIIIGPVISDKSFHLAETRNTYMFRVHRDANKVHVRQAIEAIFSDPKNPVTVERVNILNRKGKRKLNRRSRTWGRTPDRRIAFVKLAPGSSIPIFEGA
jgi:large subunit ribosomal protein L23